MTADSSRMQQLRNWLSARLGPVSFELAPASADASFRRYFRVRFKDISRIVMDAPPDKEDCQPFINVAKAFSDLGLNVPNILAADLERGFLLLTDLGDCQYLDVLNLENVDALYGAAFQSLLTLQSVGRRQGNLPIYNEALLLREMVLFRDWYVEESLGIKMDTTQHNTLEQVFSLLAKSALEQPQVWVHRDYHSRNLMVVEGHNPGILDFQDAVVGPVCYDLVSLLRDCYISWPVAQVDGWVKGYYTLARAQGMLENITQVKFQRWFDWMGMQRHLKAIGIFSRLAIRDGKPGYLSDIPRTMNYLLESSSRYPEFRALKAFLTELSDRH